jgi:thymidylate synthase
MLMTFEEQTLDDVLNRVYTALLDDRPKTLASKGPHYEQIGALICLRDPRARLSWSQDRLVPYSSIGEVLWYLAGSDEPDFISYYIPAYRDTPLQDGRVPGAYGPRIFGPPPMNQIDSAIALLRQRPTSRRAVAQIFSAADLAASLGSTDAKDLPEVPCTCTLQFLIRDGKLNLVAHMRSNDAYLGLPHDVFCFTMIQELVARGVGVELGSYFHSVGSLHLYEKDESAARRYLSEGWHDAAAMPEMPLPDQREAVQALLHVERQLRLKGDTSGIALLPLYWRDLATLLRVRLEVSSMDPSSRSQALLESRSQLSCDVFRRYLLDRAHAAG